MRRSLASAFAATALLAATASSAGAPTPADQQLAWVVAALNGAKAPAPAVLREHFTPSFLKAVPPDQLVAALASIWAQQPFRLVAVLGRQGPQGLDARIDGRHGTSLKVSIHVTAAGPHLIDGLLFQPIAPSVTSWSAVDTRLAKLASDASLYAGTADGTAHPLPRGYAGGRDRVGVQALRPGRARRRNPGRHGRVDGAARDPRRLEVAPLGRHAHRPGGEALHTSPLRRADDLGERQHRRRPPDSPARPAGGRGAA